MQLLIKKLKELDVVIKEPVQLRSGEISNFYVDIKKAYGDPQAFYLLVKAMSDVLKSDFNTSTCVAACGYGGIPLATAVAFKNNLKLSLVRDKVKNHGTKEMIDGYIPDAKDKVVVIDDVLTTGSSITQVIEVLKPTGAKILQAYVVVKRGDAQLEIPTKYLLTVGDLL